MNLGAFSVSLAVKDIQASHAFYATLGFEVFGCHFEGKTIHHIAPGPETVGARAGCLGKTGHGALMGVRMDIRDRRHGKTIDRLGRWFLSAGLERLDDAILVQTDQNAVPPAFRQQHRSQDQVSCCHVASIAV